jgi:hypothetical protein
MKSVSIRSPKSDRKEEVPRQPKRPATKKPHAPLLSPSEDLHALIANRAYELYAERNYGPGVALDDWLAAEREILSQIPPA